MTGIEKFQGSAKRYPLGGSVGVSVAAGVGNASVSFPAGYFAAAPIVVATADGGTYNWIASASAITTSGFTLTAAERDGTSGSGTITVRWVAVAA